MENFWFLCLLTFLTLAHCDPFGPWKSKCPPMYGCLGDSNSEGPVICQKFDNLTKFVDELPIPKVLEPKEYHNGRYIRKNKPLYIPHYEQRAMESKHKFHHDLPPTTIWGYNGEYPGRTLVVKEGDLIKVTYKNHLPLKHILPVDKTLMGAEGFPESRIVTHIHGLEVPAVYDGQPTATIDPGMKVDYYYPIVQDPSFLWYHDHALGITRLNVYAGLAGAFLIDQGKKYNLPRGKYDVPLILSDRSFQCDGELYYPPLVNVSGTLVTQAAEFFGRLPIVNGKVWPYFEVEPRRYLFRLLNGANSRFWNLFWENSDGPTFYYVASESNFYPYAVPEDEIFFGPGERAVIIIDFSKFAGKELILKNNANTPFPFGDPVIEGVSDTVMKFKVLKQCGRGSVDTSVHPEDYRGPMFKPVDEKKITITRKLVLTEFNNQFEQLVLRINNRTFFEPNNLNPVKGNKEIWELINVTPDTHPMHFHLLPHYTLNRQRFDVEGYLENLKFDECGDPIYPELEPYLIGEPIPPEEYERFLKDTTPSPPDYVTRIVFDWDTPFRGRYMAHCHILEHEDNEMMIPFRLRDRERCNVNEIRCSDDAHSYELCVCDYQGSKWQKRPIRGQCLEDKDDLYEVY